MEQTGVTKESPTLIRAYKKEAELEVWKQRPDGRYAYLKSFPMCRWSGQLGPKVREGDRQVPEGFYSITPGQMNPNSAYYLSFNVGYPNAYDRAYGHGGGSIMVHGACSSAGCFSMTDRQIGEIYAILRSSFNNGQRSIQMQSYPFKMNAENLAKHRLDPNIGFWKQLKEGSDHFEVAGKEPTVGVCNRRYVFDAASANGQPLDAGAACPPLKRNAEIEAQVARKAAVDDARVAELAAAGVRPVRVVYQDGGQHPDFYARVAEVSRPRRWSRRSRSRSTRRSAARSRVRRSSPWPRPNSPPRRRKRPRRGSRFSRRRPRRPSHLRRQNRPSSAPSLARRIRSAVCSASPRPRQPRPRSRVKLLQPPPKQPSLSRSSQPRQRSPKQAVSKTEDSKTMKAAPAKAIPAKTAAARQSASSQGPASLAPHRVDPKKPQASLGGGHPPKSPRPPSGRRCAKVCRDLPLAWQRVSYIFAIGRPAPRGSSRFCLHSSEKDAP